MCKKKKNPAPGNSRNRIFYFICLGSKDVSCTYYTLTFPFTTL